MNTWPKNSQTEVIVATHFKSILKFGSLEVKSIISLWFLALQKGCEPEWSNPRTYSSQTWKYAENYILFQELLKL